MMRLFFPRTGCRWAGVRAAVQRLAPAAFLLCVAITCCGRGAPGRGTGGEGGEYQWAFAQNLDGTFNPNEFCRQSLAQSLYAPDNQAKTLREAGTNVFLFTGTAESYRIYAFDTQQECETALTNMVQRARAAAP